MPSKKKPSGDGPRTSAYDHPNRKRAVIPSAQDALVDEDVKQPRVYAPSVHTPDDEPRLAWVRGDGTQVGDGAAEKHASLPLYVREEHNPAVLAARLTGGSISQGEMEGMGYTYEDLPEGAEARYQWYEHRQNWRNRIIHGESEAVMASLLDRENMAGKVQMVYFDPPYGIKYNSNFQPDQRVTDVKEGPNHRPQGDVRTLRAFRDTWHNGVHSYFDSILEKLRLFRELLSESGSLFFQIGDENVGRCVLLCDEVFGAENRVLLIPFVTTGGSSSKTMPSVADFLLWYAKDNRQHKNQQIFEEEDMEEKVAAATSYAGVELPDGSARALTSSEKRGDWRNLPKGSRMFKMSPLSSQGHSETGRSEKWHWSEMSRSIACPKGRHWSVSHESLDQLAKMNRLYQNSPEGELHWKLYFDERPGSRVNNIWQKQASASDKRYVVQTADQILDRCILLSTDPGDLVFDSTCGGATTAAAAEKWGRRWITVDVSPIAVSHARQRIATGTYPYFTIAGTPEGIVADAELWKTAGFPERAERTAQQEPRVTGPAERNPEHGFVYARVPDVSPKVLAEDLDPPPTMLVDRPHATTKRGGRKVLRVASPFTVESHTAFTYASLTEDDTDPPSNADFAADVEVLQPLADLDDDYARTVVEKLMVSPIRSGSSGHPDIHVKELQEWPGERYLTHKVIYTNGDNPDTHEGGLVILPADAPATTETLRAAATETANQIHNAELAIAIANEFDPDASQEQFGKVSVLRVVPHRDLAIKELKDDADHDLFVALGQPDIQWQDEAGDKISLEVVGWDAFDPTTGTVDAGDAGTISCMMVDIDYNGRDFHARLLHFPGADNDKLVKRLRNQLKSKLSQEHWDAMLSTATAPFPAPSSGKVAVKIVTTRGLEMTRSLDVTQGEPKPPPEPVEQSDPTPADPFPAERQRLCERIGRLAEHLREIALAEEGFSGTGETATDAVGLVSDGFVVGTATWAADAAENLRHGAAAATTPEQLDAFRQLADQLEATAQLNPTY